MSRAPVAVHARDARRKAGQAPSPAAIGSPVPMPGHLGAGERLPADVRGYFEPRFGADLSDVRLHRDAAGESAAEAAGAHAFTIGRHIAFNAGRFAPATTSGRRLLGHELAHVVQQSRGGAAPGEHSGSAVESDARQAGQATAAGAAIIPVGAASGVGIARDEIKDEEEKRKRNVGLANRAYASVLSSSFVPGFVKKGVEGTNEWLKQEAPKYGISPEGTQKIVSSVVETVGTETVAAIPRVVDPVALSVPPTPAPTPVAPPKPAPAPERDTKETEARRATERQRLLDVAIKDQRWGDVAFHLHSLSPAEIWNVLPNLQLNQIAAVYEAAELHPAIGPDSPVAYATRWAYLEREFRKSVAGSQWGWAAKYLGQMNRDQMLARIHEMDTASLQALHDAAASGPGLPAEFKVGVASAAELDGRPNAPALPTDTVGDAIYVTLEQGIAAGDPLALQAAEVIASVLFKAEPEPGGGTRVSVGTRDEQDISQRLGITRASLNRIETLVRPFGPKAHRTQMDYAGRVGNAQDLAEREMAAKLNVIFHAQSTLGSVLSSIASMKGGTAADMQAASDLGTAMEGVAPGGPGPPEHPSVSPRGGAAYGRPSIVPAGRSAPPAGKGGNFVTVPISSELPSPIGNIPFTVKLSPAAEEDKAAPEHEASSSAEDHTPAPISDQPTVGSPRRRIVSGSLPVSPESRSQWPEQAGAGPKEQREPAFRDRTDPGAMLLPPKAAGLDWIKGSQRVYTSVEWERGIPVVTQRYSGDLGVSAKEMDPIDAKGAANLEKNIRGNVKTAVEKLDGAFAPAAATNANEYKNQRTLYDNPLGPIGRRVEYGTIGRVTIRVQLPPGVPKTDALQRAATQELKTRRETMSHFSPDTPIDVVLHEAPTTTAATHEE
jgi:hypothetical protein